jgi:hypothetical protein
MMLNVPLMHREDIPVPTQQPPQFDGPQLFTMVEQLSISH